MLVTLVGAKPVQNISSPSNLLAELPYKEEEEWVCVLKYLQGHERFMFSVHLVPKHTAWKNKQRPDAPDAPENC